MREVEEEAKGRHLPSRDRLSLSLALSLFLSPGFVSLDTDKGVALLECP